MKGEEWVLIASAELSSSVPVFGRCSPLTFYWRDHFSVWIQTHSVLQLVPSQATVNFERQKDKYQRTEKCPEFRYCRHICLWKAPEQDLVCLFCWLVISWKKGWLYHRECMSALETGFKKEMNLFKKLFFSVLDVGTSRPLSYKKHLKVVQVEGIV